MTIGHGLAPKTSFIWRTTSKLSLIHISIMKLEVVTPEENMGDVIGDLNKRRGPVSYTHLSAKKIVDRKEPVIWDILEHVMKGHPVLLNREIGRAHV